MADIKVLLAEDHTLVRQGISHCLKETGLSVVGEAADGQEAVAMAQELMPDVIVMDVAMPRVNGIEATKLIKKICPSIPVLILSAYDNEQYVFALLEAGAAGYLLKDISCQGMAKAIRDVHKGESVLHPAIMQKVIKRLKKPDNPDENKTTPLSERETEVLRLAAKGMRNKDIAKSLCLSTRTVEAHLNSIFNKWNVGSRTDAVMYALKTGLFSIAELN
jgi:DNA-binding NarL/FixJ family response regulator